MQTDVLARGRPEVGSRLRVNAKAIFTDGNLDAFVDSSKQSFVSPIAKAQQANTAQKLCDTNATCKSLFVDRSCHSLKQSLIQPHSSLFALARVSTRLRSFTRLALQLATLHQRSHPPIL